VLKGPLSIHSFIRKALL